MKCEVKLDHLCRFGAAAVTRVVCSGLHCPRKEQTPRCLSVERRHFCRSVASSNAAHLTFATTAMAKLFDEENVHDFWGLSPAVDAIELLEKLPAAASQHGIHELLANSEALNVLQVLVL